MPLLRSLLLLLAALPICRSAAAQDERPAGYGTLTGIVRDSTSGAPAPGLRISFGEWEAAASGDRETWTDSSGRYVRNLSAGNHCLWIFCPESLIKVHEQPVRVAPDSTLVVDLLVHPRVCTGPPDSVDAELVGHYDSGFERSVFVPCPGTVERVWGPLLGSRTVWVGFSAAAAKAGLRRGGYYFVRWKGRLTGPGAYGHMNGAPYQLTVEQILESRTPTPGDCG